MIQTRFRPARWPSLRVSTGELHDPLFRNGHALILSTVVTSGLGFVFWILAAHNYSPAMVGKDNAAISALSFLGGLAQLNLATVLIGFVPAAGIKRYRFIALTYGICAAVGVAFATLFLVVVPHLVPTLAFIGRSWPSRLWWILSTIMWSLFVLEDGAMTGLRKAHWVPIENAGFSLAKIGLVIPFTALFPGTGIFFAWTFATLVTVVPTNVFVFVRAIPDEQRRAPEGDVTAEQLIRYAPFDFLAQLSWLAATTLLPLLIIHRLGAQANAYFSFDWLIAYVLFLVAINLGSSLIVETAVDTSQLGVQTRRVLVHLTKLLMPVVAFVVAFAPLILRLFGSAYSDRGSGALRILALSALPNAVVAIAVCALRAQRKTRYIFYLDACICVIVMLLTWILLPSMGIDGAAIAWLIALGSTSVVLLFTTSKWTASETPIFLAFHDVGNQLVRLVAKSPVAEIARASRARWSLQQDERYCSRVLPDLLKELDWSERPVQEVVRSHQVRPSLSDTTVALLPDRDGIPFAVLKIARSSRSELDLQHNFDAVSRLLANERLGAWRTLLPTCALHQARELTFSVEPAVHGISAERLLALSPCLLPDIVTGSLQAIRKLHSATSRRVRINDAHFGKLIGNSIEVLRRIKPMGCLVRQHNSALDRLEERLRAGFKGKGACLSQVHGDFSPGNVIFSPDAQAVNGILDWGQSKQLGVPSVDLLSFLLAVQCQIDDVQFGHLVQGAFFGSNWSNEQLALHAANVLESCEVGYLDLVLLSWLDHVVGNLEKSDRYLKNRIWWTTNIDPVLREFTR